MSNIVKAEESADYKTAVVFDLSDIEAQAAAIISGAEAKAAVLIDAAEKEGRLLRERATEEGKRSGLDQGRKEGCRLGADEAREDAYAKAHDEISALTASLVKSFENFSAMKGDLFRQAEEDLLKLSLLIAKKIVGREIDADAHVTSDNLNRCLEVLSRQKNVVVRVAPSAVKTLEERIPELTKRLGEAVSVKVKADETVSPGGCLVTGESGLLDATIETQFEEIERLLFGEKDA